MFAVKNPLAGPIYAVSNNAELHSVALILEVKMTEQTVRFEDHKSGLSQCVDDWQGRDLNRRNHAR